MKDTAKLRGSPQTMRHCKVCTSVSKQSLVSGDIGTSNNIGMVESKASAPLDACVIRSLLFGTTLRHFILRNTTFSGRPPNIAWGGHRHPNSVSVLCIRTLLVPQTYMVPH